MITIVAQEAIDIVRDKWMPLDMVIMIIGDDVVVYKSGKVSMISMDELKEIAGEAHEQAINNMRHDDARQSV